MGYARGLSAFRLRSRLVSAAQRKVRHASTMRSQLLLSGLLGDLRTAGLTGIA